MKKKNPSLNEFTKSIISNVLAELDDAQLAQIAGGVTDENPDETDESCASLFGCSCCNTKVAE